MYGNTKYIRITSIYKNSVCTIYIFRILNRNILLLGNTSIKNTSPK